MPPHAAHRLEVRLNTTESSAPPKPESAITRAVDSPLIRGGLTIIVGVLTGNVLKDPDYVYRYHTGQLEAPDGQRIQPTFGNEPIVVPNDPDKIAAVLDERRNDVE